MLFASGLCVFLISVLTHNSLFTWGWRVPFLIGVIIGCVGLYIRHNTTETTAFIELKKSATTLKNPLADSLRNSLNAIFTTFITASMTSVLFYTIYIYLPSYLAESRGLSSSMYTNFLGLLAYTLTLPLAAILADLIGKKKIISFSFLILILALYPLFYLIITSNMVLSITAEVVLSIIIAFCIAPIPALWAELFPTNSRATGFAIGYNFAVAIFGGLTPLFVLWLTKVSGDNMAPTFMILAMSITSLAILITKSKRVRYGNL